MRRFWEFVSGITFLEIFLYGLASVLVVIFLGVLSLGMAEAFVWWEDSLIDILQRRDAGIAEGQD